jgi:hypothetical protein
MYNEELPAKETYSNPSFDSLHHPKRNFILIWRGMFNTEFE